MVRAGLSSVEIVHLLAEVGAYGISFHDNDLAPIDTTRADRDSNVAEFKKALADTSLVVPMATTSLFSDPAFKDGAFTANDPKVRAQALHKRMHAIDLGIELDAKIYVFWGSREGIESDAMENALGAGKGGRSQGSALRPRRAGGARHALRAAPLAGLRSPDGCAGIGWEAGCCFWTFGKDGYALFPASIVQVIIM